MRRRADGKAVEFGVNYAGIRFLKESGVVSKDRAAELEAGDVPPAYAVPIPRQYSKAVVDAALSTLSETKTPRL